MDKNLQKIIDLENGRRDNMLRRKNPCLQVLFWECTLRCNLNCVHCGSDCKHDSLKADMPLTDFTRVLDEVALVMKPENIIVVTTGGEVLLRKDIIECGREITKRGFFWRMVTNGMLLTPQMLRDLMNAGLGGIAVSLDGLEDDHNWMRGNPKSFERVVGAINALAQTSEDSLFWDVITCVNKHNINDLPRIKDFVISLGVKHWRVVTVFPSGRAKEHHDLQLDREQLRMVFDFIVSTSKEGRIHLSYGCEGFLGTYENEIRDYQYFCQAGVNVASILHDGSISGCLSIRSKYDQGNIYHDSFIDVWTNRFQDYRDVSWKKKGACQNCEAWRWCEGNGMHLRDNDGNLILCNYQKLFHNNKNL